MYIDEHGESVSRHNGGRVGNDHRASQEKRRDTNSIPDRGIPRRRDPTNEYTLQYTVRVDRRESEVARRERQRVRIRTAVCV